MLGMMHVDQLAINIKDFFLDCFSLFLLKFESNFFKDVMSYIGSSIEEHAHCVIINHYS